MSGISPTIAIASGKGGTGKTLVATNLAMTAARSGLSTTLVDCDVEAPNDHLFLPADATIHDVEATIAAVVKDQCTACGACRDACMYGAIRILAGTVVVFPELCHGCGLCTQVCMTGGMTEVPVRVGELLIGAVQGMPAESAQLNLVTGRLDVGEVKAPTVIGAARRRGEASQAQLTLLDAPPGVACAAVAAVRGADVALLVTEETAFGMHDLDLAWRLVNTLGIPAGIVINRAEEHTGGINVTQWAIESGIPVLASIPFDRRIASAYADGELVIDAVPSEKERFVQLLERARELASGSSVTTQAGAAS
ncbi:MAG: P-loop NTPase [Actinomycetota bacterium]|jgi:MinD superfamily P-loop ATPase|nr:P-loop NTPase [Actinomycetota bacterium]